MNKYISLLCYFLLFSVLCTAQKTSNKDVAGKKDADSLKTDLKQKGFVVDGVVKKKINPLAPSRAAFFSALVPGLGQIYNKKYWKAPIVWAAVGIGTGTYLSNNTQLNVFRDAFKRRRAGFMDTNPLTIPFSDAALEDAQESIQEQRDLALLVTIVLYVLNIVDANVDAHLKQFNVDTDLSLDVKPYLEYNPVSANPNYGIGMTIKF